MEKLNRCEWVKNSNKLYQKYHDEEWGRPVHDDLKLFEMINLEGQSCGLSFYLILSRRELLRKAFDNFRPEVLITYDDNKIDSLMNAEGVIKHRLKIKAVVENAKAYFKIKEKYGSFDKFLWSYTNNTPIKGKWENMQQIPTQTELSKKLSKDLKKFGFKFVGNTIIYSFMQAVGMVNDHTKSCFLYNKIK